MMIETYHREQKIKTKYMAHVIVETHKNNFGSGRYVWFISLIVTIGGFLFGFDTAIISGAVQLVKSQYGLSTSMEGWFVSSALVGCIAGVSFAGAFSDRFGRKQTLLLSAFLFVLSSVGCALSPDIRWLIFFRIMGGVGIGIASMLAPLYISEFAPQKIRGSLVSVYQLAITIGIVCAYFSNAFILNTKNATHDNGILKLVFHDEVWRGMLAMNFIPAVLFFILLFFVPQTPRWLVKKRRSSEALYILSKISGQREANEQLNLIEASLKTPDQSLGILLKPGYRLALLIGILLPFLGQFSGINAIIYYGPSIFNEAGFTLSSSLDGQVIIGLANMLATLIAVRLVDKAGRKPLLIIGTTGIIISLVLTAVLFYFKVTSGWIIIASILIFICCYAFSLGPVQWVIISEIFPNHIRGRAMSIATMSLWLGATLVAQIFPWLLHMIGAVGVFLFFAVCSVLTILFTLKYIPETKNKSLEEIEKIWKK